MSVADPRAARREVKCLGCGRKGYHRTYPGGWHALTPGWCYGEQGSGFACSYDCAKATDERYAHRAAADE